MIIYNQVGSVNKHLQDQFFNFNDGKKALSVFPADSSYQLDQKGMIHKQDEFA